MAYQPHCDQIKRCPTSGRSAYLKKPTHENRRQDLTGPLASLIFAGTSDVVRIEMTLLADFAEFQLSDQHGEISFWSLHMYRKHGIKADWNKKVPARIFLRGPRAAFDDIANVPYLAAPCRCVRMPCWRASLRRASPHQPSALLPATCGSMKSSMTASG
jgi:hypothetical protein